MKSLEETIAAIPEVEVEALHLGGNRTPVSEGDIRVRLKPLRERSRGMLDSREIGRASCRERV